MSEGSEGSENTSARLHSFHPFHFFHFFTCLSGAAFASARSRHSPCAAIAMEGSAALWRLVPVLPLPAWVAGRGGS